jgi:ActR/RegA family two-component response regulator
MEKTMSTSQTILLVTARSSQMQPFVQALGKGVNLITVDSVSEALNAARNRKITLAVVDEEVAETAGLDIVRRLLQINAFVHTAVLSAAAEADFHERSEGLGVLAQLPVVPEPKDAQHLRGLLDQMMP